METHLKHPKRGEFDAETPVFVIESIIFAYFYDAVQQVGAEPHSP
jgi:hypothetical protein